MPTCNVMSTNGRCTLSRATSTSIECTCDICSNARRGLGSSSSPVMVATQVSAMAMYVLDGYVDTMSQTDINWYETIQQTIIMVVSFAVVWVVVILVVPLKSRALHTIHVTKKTIIRVSKKLSSKGRLSAVVPDMNDDTNISPEQAIGNYILKYLPIIYRDEVNYFTRLVTQLVRKHRYYDFLTNKDTDNDVLTKYLNAFKILTLISVIILLLLYYYH